MFKKQRLDPSGRFFQETSAAVKVSYKVSLIIAKQKKAHTTEEDLVLPAAKEMVGCALGDESAKSHYLPV